MAESRSIILWLRSNPIGLFSDEKLDKARLLHGKLCQALRLKIRVVLLDGARGMYVPGLGIVPSYSTLLTFAWRFRWVELQIQSLLPLKVAADIEQRLGSLPATLEASYWDIYRHILESGEHSSKLAILTFQWLMYARETISIEAFASISSVALSSQGGNHSAFTGEQIIDVCANLVVRRKTSFELSHLSVREFLEGLEQRNVNEFLPARSNASIAQACLQHLSHKIDTIEWPHNPDAPGNTQAALELTQEWAELTQIGVNTSNNLVRIACHEKLRFGFSPVVLKALQNLLEHVEKGNYKGNVEIRRDFDGVIWIRCSCTKSWRCDIDSTVRTALDLLHVKKNQSDEKREMPEKTSKAPIISVNVESGKNEHEIRTGDAKDANDGYEGKKGKEDTKSVALSVSPTAAGVIIRSSRFDERVARVARALINQDPRGDVHYTAKHWVYHVKRSEECRTSDPLASLLRSFLVGDAGNFSKPFALWCALIRVYDNDFNSIGYELEDLKLLCATEKPYNPSWIAYLSNWIDVVDYLCTLGHEDGEERFSAWTVLARTGLISNKRYLKITPLLYALYCDNLALADCILRGSFETTPASRYSVATPQSLRYPLEEAVRANHEGFIKLFLGRDHDGQEGEGQAFIVAAAEGLRRPMEILFQHNPGVASSYGSKALLAAVVGRHVRCVAFLLEEPLNVSSSGRDGNLALYFAAQNMDAYLMRILLKHSIGVRAMSKTLIISVSDGDEESAELLLAHGAQREDLAVVNALRADTPVAAIRLIRAGFNFQGMFMYLQHRRTALHFAVDKDFVDVVRVLLDSGAAVNARDGNGQTPLHLGACKDREECVRILLEAGADVMLEDREGRIPLDYAKRERTELLIREHMEKLLERLLARSETAHTSR